MLVHYIQSISYLHWKRIWQNSNSCRLNTLKTTIEEELDYYLSLLNRTMSWWAKPMQIVGRYYSAAEESQHISNARCRLSDAKPAAHLWPYEFVASLLRNITSRINLQNNAGILSGSRARRRQTRASTIVASNGYTTNILKPYKQKASPIRGTNSRSLSLRTQLILSQTWVILQHHIPRQRWTGWLPQSSSWWQHHTR